MISDASETANSELILSSTTRYYVSRNFSKRVVDRRNTHRLRLVMQIALLLHHIMTPIFSSVRYAKLLRNLHKVTISSSKERFMPVALY